MCSLSGAPYQRRGKCAKEQRENKPSHKCGLSGSSEDRRVGAEYHGRRGKAQKGTQNGRIEGANSIHKSSLKACVDV